MSSGDWEKLSTEQQKAVNIWRERVSKTVLAEVEQFEKNYPDLRLTYNFTSEPLLRADHPVIFEELASDIVGCDYCDNTENVTTIIDRTGERPDIHICRDCYASGQCEEL